MATHKYNIPGGVSRDGDVTPTVGAAIASGLVQVTVDLAVPATKREVLHAIDTVSRYIRRHDWPPA